MSFKPFLHAAKMMRKYNSDSWHAEKGPTPIIHKSAYENLKLEVDPLAIHFLEEYDKVKDSNWRTPKVRYLLQILISFDILNVG